MPLEDGRGLREAEGSMWDWSGGDSLPKLHQDQPETLENTADPWALA